MVRKRKKNQKKKQKQTILDELPVCPEIRSAAREYAQTGNLPHLVVDGGRYIQARASENLRPGDIVVSNLEGEVSLCNEEGQNVENLLTEMFEQADRYIGGHPTMLLKPHPMDQNFPHTCYKCARQLKYEHALKQAKVKGFSKEQFDKMWECEHVEFYCCQCYRDRTSDERHINIINTRHHSPFFEECMRRYAYRWGMVNPVLRIRDPELTPEQIQEFREIMNNPGRHRDWLVLPREAVENVEFIEGGYIGQFRFVNENNEILFEDHLPEPRFTHEFLYEENVIAPQLGFIEFRVIVRGTYETYPVYMYAQGRRVMHSEVPEDYRTISIQYAPNGNNEPVKLQAAADIILAWLMQTPFLQQHQPVPEGILRYIQFEVLDPPVPTYIPLDGYYAHIVEMFRRSYRGYLYQAQANVVMEYRERVLWRGENVVAHPDEQQRLNEYAEFLLQQIAAGWGIPVEILTGPRADVIIHDHVFDEHLICTICGRTSVEIDANESYRRSIERRQERERNEMR